MKTAAQFEQEIDCENARISELYRKQAAPLLQEIERLQAVLEDYAKRLQNKQLTNWLQREVAAYQQSFEKVGKFLNKVDIEEAKMKARSSQTYEEALARYEHTKNLAQMARAKVEEQIKFLERKHKLFADKVAEFESSPPSGK